MNENCEILDEADQDHHGRACQTHKEGYFKRAHQEYENCHDVKSVRGACISIS